MSATQFKLSKDKNGILISNIDKPTNKLPLIPKLQLGLLKQQEQDESDNDFCDENDHFEELSTPQVQNQQFLMSTWRSIDTCLQSTRRGGDNSSLQKQLEELQSQIEQMMNFQSEEQVTRQIHEEEESQKKVNQLINNLQAQHLKISEENKRLLSEVLLCNTLGKTQDFNQSATIAFIDTLNQAVCDQREEDHELIKEIQEQQADISNLKDLNERLIIEKEDLQKEYQNQLEELGIKIQELESENVSMKQKLLKRSQRKDCSSRLSENKENQSCNFQQSISQVDGLISYINELTNQKITNPAAHISTLEPSSIDSKIVNALTLLVKSCKSTQTTNISCSQNVHRRGQSLNIFKQQIRRNSFSEIGSSTQQNTVHHQQEEPTPRFILDQQVTPNKELGSTLFKTNLNLNRSMIFNGTSQNRFNITLNNVFRRRPNIDSNSKHEEQLKELWGYIFEIEQEQMEQQSKFQRQKDESQLEISVYIGANEAVKNVKSNLETQVEELAFENQLKTQKILQLELYNTKLYQTVSEYDKCVIGSGCEEEAPSFMKNLKGILSPTQFKKIQQFLNNEERPQDKSINMRDHHHSESLIGGIDLYQEKLNDISGINDSLELSMMHNNNNNNNNIQNVFLENSFSNDRAFNETRIRPTDSKNSTLSFKHLNINVTQETQQLGQSSQNPLISPIYHRGFQVSKARNQKGFMLIQDNNNNLSIQEYEQIEDEQRFLQQQQQQSVIINSSVDQSQFLNTHNNKTLNSLFRFNNQRGTNNSISNGGGALNISNGSLTGQKPLFNFKRKQQKQNTSLQKSFQGGQTGVFIQQLHDNFQSQLQDMKDEKLKLIHVLNKFLMLPQESSVQQIEESFNASKDSYQMPNKQYFEDFRLQITQAFTLREQEMKQLQEERDKLVQEKTGLKKEQEKYEQRRTEFKLKVQKLNEKTEEFNIKYKLLDERDNLIEQNEKKLMYRKQAQDEEWKRLDKKKIDIKRQEEAIQKEWENLKKELGELTQLRKEVKDNKFKVKEQRAKLKQERSILEEKEENLISESSRNEQKEKEFQQRDRQQLREQQRIDKQKEDMKQQYEEIEKQKTFIGGERQWIENERHELESKRSLSGMFIPEIKSLVKKMQHPTIRGANKSLNQRSSQNEDRIRVLQRNQQILSQQNHNNSSSNQTLTNMTAYLKKCTDGCNHDSSINCDLHKSVNKSTMSLQNLCNFHQNSSKLSISSGRAHSKPANGKVTLSKAFLKDASFLKQNQSSSSLSSFFKFPKSTKNLNQTSKIDDDNDDIDGFEDENKENMQQAFNGLESILKNTAKFRESRNRLEKSYNSLMKSSQLIGKSNNNMLNSQCSFMSFDEKLDEMEKERIMDQSFSRDEL